MTIAAQSACSRGATCWREVRVLAHVELEQRGVWTHRLGSLLYRGVEAVLNIIGTFTAAAARATPSSPSHE